MAPLTLRVLPERFTIARLPPNASWTPPSNPGSFLSITRTSDELSIVAAIDQPIAGATYDVGWRCIKIEGPLALDQIGILTSLSACLSGAGVSLFAVATYDTDYVLVREERLNDAVRALQTAGHQFVASAPPRTVEPGN